MNNNEKLQLAIALTASTLAVTLAARSMINTHREEEAKREAMRENANLDVQAILRASKVMNERIDRGEIRGLAQLTDVMRNEIDFQKIAIREED